MVALFQQAPEGRIIGLRTAVCDHHLLGSDSMKLRDPLAQFRRSIRLRIFQGVGQEAGAILPFQ